MFFSMWIEHGVKNWQDKVLGKSFEKLPSVNAVFKNLIWCTYQLNVLICTRLWGIMPVAMSLHVLSLAWSLRFALPKTLKLSYV